MLLSQKQQKSNALLECYNKGQAENRPGKLGEDDCVKMDPYKHTLVERVLFFPILRHSSRSLGHPY